jgi:hypothetical protein
VLRRWHVHLLILHFFVLEFLVDGIISVGITGWVVCFGRKGGRVRVGLCHLVLWFSFQPGDWYASVSWRGVCSMNVPFFGLVPCWYFERGCVGWVVGVSNVFFILPSCCEGQVVCGVHLVWFWVIVLCLLVLAVIL